MIGPRRRSWAQTSGRCRATGKRVYATEHQASLALVNCQRYGRVERRAYQCEHCGFWHLTHEPLAWREGAR